jgi:hypothetical protein
VLVSAEPENDPNRAASFVIQTDGIDSLSFQSLNDGVAGVLLDFATISEAAFDAPLSQPLSRTGYPWSVGFLYQRLQPFPVFTQTLTTLVGNPTEFGGRHAFVPEHHTIRLNHQHKLFGHVFWPPKRSSVSGPHVIFAS